MILNEYKPLMYASQLPHYAQNPEIERRFLTAAAQGQKQLPRATNIPGIKTVTDAEHVVAHLKVFLKFRRRMRAEFWKRLDAFLPCKKRRLFVDVLNQNWTDGGPKRSGPEILALKASVRDYVKTRARNTTVFVDETLHADVEPMFTYDEIANLFSVNNDLVHLLMQEYVANLPPASYISATDDLWIHRGIHLSKPLCNGLYKEHRYMSSYSLAVSVPEQFANCVEGKMPALVNGRLYDFYGRYIFFSELIPDMKLKQFEFAIAPHWTPISITDKGLHSGIREYVLEPQR